MNGPTLSIKIRLTHGVIGPGKITLLEHVDSLGGISAAAREMGMTYRRAWHLIDSLNKALGRPVVATATGGTGGGGAHLTEFGRELVQRYRATMPVLEEDAAPLLKWLAGIDSGAEAADPG